MRAFVQTGYGAAADVIMPAELEIPTPGPGDVVIRVHAASLAAGDRFLLRGVPYLARFSVGFPKPKPNYVVGLDCAGVVEALGEDVSGFSVGDAVYGECRGACAQFARASAERIALKPESLSFEQAAAVPTSGCTALQGLRDQAKLRSGHKVLINGSTGGVGTFAVQIAHALGAHVTAVCSTGNIELVKSLGADEVIDYTKEDFTVGGPRYDAIFDNVASHPTRVARRALVPGGIHVPSSGHGGMGWIIRAALEGLFVREQGSPFLAVAKRDDLEALARMIDEGLVSPVVEATYPFEQTVDALTRVDAGHTRGKLVIAVSGEAAS